MGKWEGVGEGFILLPKKCMPEKRLNLCEEDAFDRVKAMPVQEDWHSAMWQYEDIGDGFFRLHNRWHHHRKLTLGDNDDVKDRVLAWHTDRVAAEWSMEPV